MGETLLTKSEMQYCRLKTVYALQQFDICVSFFVFFVCLFFKKKEPERKLKCKHKYISFKMYKGVINTKMWWFNVLSVGRERWIVVRPVMRWAGVTSGLRTHSRLALNSFQIENRNNNKKEKKKRREDSNGTNRRRSETPTGLGGGWGLGAEGGCRHPLWISALSSFWLLTRLSLHSLLQRKNPI